MILLLGNNMEAHTLKTHETKSLIIQLPAPTITKQQEQQNSHHIAEKNKSGERRRKNRRPQQKHYLYLDVPQLHLTVGEAKRSKSHYKKNKNKIIAKLS
jgi:hypothetical protein